MVPSGADEFLTLPPLSTLLLTGHNYHEGFRGLTRSTGVDSARAKTRLPPSGDVIDAIVSERARIKRFLTVRTGSEAEAEDLLQQSLLKALQHRAQLRRGEKAVPWFYRILRNAIAEHYRQKSSNQRRTDNLWSDMRAAGEDIAAPPDDWNKAVCTCLGGLLPGLKPRYAELIRRIDLKGEPKTAVSRDLKIKVGTLDVALHRARSALRRRLEVLCGARSREKCLAGFGDGENAETSESIISSSVMNVTG